MGHCCTLLLLALAGPVAAQQGSAVEAIAVARAGRFDSALALLARARSADPGDAEVRLAQARVLGWAGRQREAIALFDSILAVSPANSDAMVGLGYVYHWQRREGAAKKLADQALELDSANTDAQELRRAIRTRTRGTVDVSANWSNDSDHNTNFWQTLALSTPLTGDVRILATAGILEASDRVRDARRYGAEAGLGWAFGRVELSGLAGARRLEPDGGTSRTAATYRANLGWHPDPRLGLAAGYARYPFDEIASLIGRDLDIESLEGGFDARIARGLMLGGGLGRQWLSDGNRRTDGRAAITHEIGRHFSIGANGRALGYRQPGIGYFSPDRFHLLEGTAAVRVRRDAWNGRLSGGLGGQQIGRGSDTQAEWHVEAGAGRDWGDGNRIEAFGGVTNSAVSSTTGAFRYRTAGIALRLGL